MNNFKYFVFVLSTFVLFSCKKVDENLDLKYEVLNQLISEDLILDKSIIDSTKYVYQITIPQDLTFKEKFSNIKNEEEILEPPFGRISVVPDSIFTSRDADYISAQTEINYNFTLNKNKIHHKVEFINTEQLLKIQKNYSSADDFWDQFRKEFGEKCIRSYSLPYFNQKKNICIITISMGCGSLYGGGGTYILKKINGKWKHFKTIDSYVN